MSNLDADPAESTCTGDPAGGPALDILEPRHVLIGKTTQVRRLLPHKDHRMVGAWCFVDHYGPDDVRGRHGMWVPPHPHTGLQTVSWLVEGRVLHRDSVGSEYLITPGALGIMTAGDGISHSEESPGTSDPVLHGVQLWVALPDAVRRTAAPAFDAFDDLPEADLGAVRARVLVGTVGPATSPAPTATPLVGADLTVRAGGASEVPLRPDFEHAVLALDDRVEVEGVPLDRGQMLYLGTGRTAARVAAPAGGRAMLLGGEPFAEELVMWWNFVARSHEEVVRAREDWMASTGRFGTVTGFPGDALPAPEMPTTRLRPRGRRR